MNKTLKIILMVAGVLTLAVTLVAVGVMAGRQFSARAAYGPASNRGNWGSDGSITQPCTGPACTFGQDTRSFGQGMMGRSFKNPCAFSRGMIGRFFDGSNAFGRGMMGRFFDDSRSGGFGMGPGMMGNWPAWQAGDSTPLTMDAARTALESYLENSGNPDMAVEEIMLFERNAYAVIVDESTGQATMELLVQPGTLAVFPEYGPARMWNTQYGMMRGGRGASGGGCAFGLSTKPNTVAASEMTLDMAAAVAKAQDYLAENLPDAQLVEEGIAFSGYYTFDYQQKGELAGMLSVNGYSGQVWLHNWHGQFIEEWEAAETE